MKQILISVLFIALVQTTLTHAEGIRGTAFTDSGLTWREMPLGWITQPVQPVPEAPEADLAVTLDQQLYAPLLPVIQAYAAKN